jgi:hypothetical protein
MNASMLSWSSIGARRCVWACVGQLGQRLRADQFKLHAAQAIRSPGDRRRTATAVPNAIPTRLQA